MDDLVPKDHLLRKVEAAVDFTKIYEIVEDLYCKNNGRPSTDPAVLFKTANKNNTKTVEKHIWTDYLEPVEDYRHTPFLRGIFERRKETIECVFADAKEKCAMRLTYLRGLTRSLGWVRLKFAAMNLKKFALHKWHSRSYFTYCLFFRQFLIFA